MDQIFFVIPVRHEQHFVPQPGSQMIRQMLRVPEEPQRVFRLSFPQRPAPKRAARDEAPKRARAIRGVALI